MRCFQTLAEIENLLKMHQLVVQFSTFNLVFDLIFLRLIYSQKIQKQMQQKGRTKFFLLLYVKFISIYGLYNQNILTISQSELSSVTPTELTGIKRYYSFSLHIINFQHHFTAFINFDLQQIVVLLSFPVATSDLEFININVEIGLSVIMKQIFVSTYSQTPELRWLPQSVLKKHKNLRLGLLRRDWERQKSRSCQFACFYLQEHLFIISFLKICNFN